MKTLIRFCLAAWVVVSLFSCNINMAQDEKEVPSLVGTWEYTGDVGGMLMATENNFIFIATFKPDSLFSDSLNTTEILDRYNNMAVIAGTHIIGDSLVTCTIQYNKDPNFVGTTLKYLYSIKGDDLTWKVLDDNGNVSLQGTSKRLD